MREIYDLIYNIRIGCIFYSMKLRILWLLIGVCNAIIFQNYVK